MATVKTPDLKRSSAAFLQIVIVLIGIATITFLLWEPHVEGRNAHAAFFEVYRHDFFLIYAYVASIPFFVALYQAFKVLGYAGRDEVFTPPAVRAMRTIKFCAIALIGFVVVAEVFILKHDDKEDPGAGVFLGLLITSGSAVIATAAAVFERILQNAVDLKSENDLTV